MTTFIALYRGVSVREAKLIAVSVDPSLVAEVSAKILKEEPSESKDPIITQLEHGRKEALRLIHREASDESG